MWEIKVEVNPCQAETLDEMLAERELENWHVYSEAYGGRAVLTGYFESESAARAAWRTLEEELPPGIVVSAAECRSLPDRDWRESYKTHFQKWHFEGLHWVPVWERGEFEPPEGEEVVWLDPGMAFGTGNHETTRLCVERMVEARRVWEAEGRAPAGLTVVDAGCGSGILAISAAKCGFGNVIGFDSDPVAVEVSKANAELNQLSSRVDFFEADLVSGLEERTADLVIANIQADVLCRHAPELAAAVKPGGRLVLSGILAEEMPSVERRFQEALPGATFATRRLGEWADLVARVRQGEREL